MVREHGVGGEEKRGIEILRELDQGLERKRACEGGEEGEEEADDEVEADDVGELTLNFSFKFPQSL